MLFTGNLFATCYEAASLTITIFPPTRSLVTLQDGVDTVIATSPASGYPEKKKKKGRV